jgi:hypothetical protein
MADLTQIFETTGISTPKLPRQQHGDALATALLTSILADLAALKDAARNQRQINANLIAAGRAQSEFDAEQVALNAAAAARFDSVARLGDRVNQLAAIVYELDERLHAIDGKRSVAIEGDAVAADTAVASAPGRAERDPA